MFISPAPGRNKPEQVLAFVWRSLSQFICLTLAGLVRQASQIKTAYIFDQQETTTLLLNKLFILGQVFYFKISKGYLQPLYPQFLNHFTHGNFLKNITSTNLSKTNIIEHSYAYFILIRDFHNILFYF